MDRKCSELRKDGEPCRGRPVTGGTLCPAHGGRLLHAPGYNSPWCTPWPGRRVISPALAAMLTEARRARGLSLRKAARLAGCTPGTIVHLEKGRCAPSVITASGIIDAYKLGPCEAERLMAEAVDGAGKNSPYKAGL